MKHDYLLLTVGLARSALWLVALVLPFVASLTTYLIVG